ncbi:hypothetical protein [Buttiauxella gaviniae]|jgi:hypothetical protein|uniref:hypothetical protein n=1 Tax=Buttiauxella gaviniae TaxID=82990 RepID=UPI003C765425
MKSKLAYSSTCSESLYDYLYRKLQHRSAEENQSLYNEAISKCRTQKQIKKKAGCYSGAWQKLFNAWCENRIPNIVAITLLGQQFLTASQCDDVIAFWK